MPAWGVCFSFFSKFTKTFYAFTDLTKHFHIINVNVKYFIIVIALFIFLFQFCSLVSSMQGTEAYLGRLCQLEWWPGDLCGPGRCHHLPRTFWPLHGHCPPYHLPVSLFLASLSTKSVSFLLGINKVLLLTGLDNGCIVWYFWEE